MTGPLGGSVCGHQKGWEGPSTRLKSDDFQKFLDDGRTDAPRPGAWQRVLVTDTAKDKAHTIMAECSDRGLCDRASGECACDDGFFGAGCEYSK